MSAEIRTTSVMRGWCEVFLQNVFIRLLSPCISLRTGPRLNSATKFIHAHVTLPTSAFRLHRMWKCGRSTGVRNHSRTAEHVDF